MNTKDRANVYRAVFIICLLLSSIFLLSKWIDIKSMLGGSTKSCSILDLANNKRGDLSIYMDEGFEKLFDISKIGLIVTLIDNVVLLFTVLYPKGLTKSWSVHIIPLPFTIIVTFIPIFFNKFVSIRPNINLLWIIIFSISSFICCHQFFQLIDEEYETAEDEYEDCYTCPLCGIEISENANFCPNCGTPFQHNGNPAVPEKNIPIMNTPTVTDTPSNVNVPAPDYNNPNNYRICPNCGNSVWWQDEYCPVCEAAVRQSSSSPLPTHYGAEKKPAVINKQPAVTESQPTHSAPAAEQSSTSQEYILCPHCYRVIDKNAAFCPYCNEFVQSNKQ